MTIIGVNNSLLVPEGCVLLLRSNGEASLIKKAFPQFGTYTIGLHVKNIFMHCLNSQLNYVLPRPKPVLSLSIQTLTSFLFGKHHFCSQ